MKSRALYFIISIFSLIILSCGDIVENIEESTPHELIIVNSLKNGEVITPDHTISFKVLSPQTGMNDDSATAAESGDDNSEGESSPEHQDSTDEDSRLSLEISLYDNAGLLLLQKTSTDFETDTDYELDIASNNVIDTGLYSLEFKLSGKTDLLEKKIITFFYSRENFIINGIESLPPVIYPGTTVELKADLLIPEDSNPFLRWKENGKYLYSGLYSEGSAAILWTAPGDVGVYSITLEVFPAGPFNAADFPFNSDNSMRIELFVSKLNRSNVRNLNPLESYYTLFQFNGDTKDAAGVIKETKNFTTRNIQAGFIGKPLLVYKEDDLGYRLDGNTGLQIPGSIFPVSGGKLQPFTLTIGIEPDRLEEQENILSYKSNDNSFEFRLFLDSKLFYNAYFRINKIEFTSASLIKLDKQHFLLSLSVLPDAENAEVTWYYNGIYSNSVSNEIENKNINSTGVTIVGGKEGFSGIIYEIGVYYKDNSGKNNIDRDLFRSIVKQKYPDTFLFADSFDNPTLPAEYRISGEYVQKASLMQLFSHTAFTLPAVSLEDDPVNILIHLKTADEGEIRIKLGDQIALTLTTAGKIIIGNTVSGTYPVQAMLNLIIDPDQGKIIIPGEDDPISVDIPALKDAGNFILEFYNSDTSPLTIDYITILKKRI